MRDKYIPILSDNLQCFDTEVKRLNDEQTEEIRNQQKQDKKEPDPKKVFVTEDP